MATNPPRPLGRDPGRADLDTPTGVPVDAAGRPLIPELVGRAPTRTEQFLISGEPLAAASTNVEEFWWRWGHDTTYEPRLFVRFLSGHLGYYEGVPLAVAVAFVEADSPGRFVWNKLRDVYPWHRLSGGTGARKPAQVVRLINTPKRGR